MSGEIKTVPLGDEHGAQHLGVIATSDWKTDEPQVYVALWGEAGHQAVWVTPDEADEMALALMAKATEARG